jgi:hypothetical protein
MHNMWHIMPHHTLTSAWFRSTHSRSIVMYLQCTCINAGVGCQLQLRALRGPGVAPC